MIISIFGRVLTMMSWAPLALPSSEFELAKCIVLVGVGMWVVPVNILFPTFRGRSP
mgnify:CR=1 FL=1